MSHARIISWFIEVRKLTEKKRSKTSMLDCLWSLMGKASRRVVSQQTFFFLQINFF